MQEPRTGRMVGRKEGGVGWLVIDNPAKRNAIGLEMWQEAGAILDGFAADDELRCLVVTGAGDRAFASGADLSSVAAGPAENPHADYDRIAGAGRHKLATFPKPVIAMIRGYCLGGGLGVALACDLRIAAEDSSFGIPAARLGIAYSIEHTQRLVDLIGPGNTLELLMTGRRIDALHALRIGLINQVVPVAELEATVRDLAATLADNAPLSVRASKRIVGLILNDPDGRDPGLAERLRRECATSDDAREGRLAFKEKRRPVFRGR